MAIEKNKHGHRSRLKKEFLQIGGLSDTSLLELLLTYSIPRKDVKPLAEKLLLAFGSFSNLLSAPREKLKAIKGLGENSQILLELVARISGTKSLTSALQKPPNQPKVKQPSKKEKNRYNASFTVGALLVPETRLVCRHLLKHQGNIDWDHLFVHENILQQRTPASSKRIGALIKQRLDQVSPELHKYIAEGESGLALQAILVATIKQNKLLGDFMNTVLKDHFRTFKSTLEKREWTRFFEELEVNFTYLGAWSDLTKRKLGINIFRALIDLGYLSDTKNLLLQRVSIHPQIKSYLEENNENYVLDSMDICQ